ncbi:MAG: hypothetical protein JO033_28815 [Acidobacteriaceae bacterium]|nr:hypothetical protein [Acidobacteriaceae bacterium]
MRLTLTTQAGSPPSDDRPYLIKKIADLPLGLYHDALDRLQHCIIDNMDVPNTNQEGSLYRRIGAMTSSRPLSMTCLRL